MALTTTTLSSAVGATDRSIVVAATTGFGVGYKVLVDKEMMEVAKDYVSTSTTVPVLRGREGSVQSAHVVTTNVTVGTGTDWQDPAAGTLATLYNPIPVFYSRSVTATSSLTLPPPQSIAVITLNGTSAITLTIAAPTKDMDGTIMFLISNGVAQHIYTFTSGLGGVGSGYTTVTPASAARGSIMVVACNGYWNAISGPGWSGTVTKATCALA